ncbi:MAG TPA: helix-turn-helix domain-containing protein, partial [Vicinamibacteria bacterium]
MGLTQKILLFTSLLVVALVLASLGFTTWQAEKLAQENIEKGLAETRSLWGTFEADRFSKLKLGIRTLSNDTFFKALVQRTIDEPDPADETLFNTLGERNLDIAAALGCTRHTVQHWRDRFASEGLPGLADRPHCPPPRRYGPDIQAKIVVLACQP